MAKNSTVIFINLISFIQWVFRFSSFAIVLISLQQDFETGRVIVKTHFFFLQFLDFVHYWLQPELDSNESLLQCQLLSVILITAINPALIQN